MNESADPLNIALHHHRAGRLDKAVEIYREVVEQDPPNGIALYHLGVAMFQLGEAAAGLDYVNRAHRADPANSRISDTIERITGAIALNELMENRGPVKEIFTTIYKHNVWGGADSRSGTGSDLTQTAAVRHVLPQLVSHLGVGSVLDIPCGDFSWMKACDLGPVTYIGADIVDDLITALQSAFGNHRRGFRVLDLIADDLPKCDLVLCREVMVHLSFEHALAAIDNIKSSGATFLLTTTFTARESNRDIKTGGWRPLNLRKPPFDFSAPDHLIDERCTEGDGQFADKALGLWRLADI